jgi:hypothetical protein
MPRVAKEKEQQDGLAVDRTGGPVVVPTANVIALNEAANRRQDDLRNLTNALTAAQIHHVIEMATLRADHAKEIRLLESDRLDKIRQVDVLAGNTAADRALVAIQTLDRTTQANAETLRSMVATTATAIATQTGNTVAQQNERIAALEKSSYTGIGKQAVADPMMAELVAEMKRLRESTATGVGKQEGISWTGALIMGSVAFIAAVLGIAGVLYAVLKP